MSRARDRIVEELAARNWNADLPDRLMVIVRETVARAFERAADELESPERRNWATYTPQYPRHMLRQWAAEARAENNEKG